ncbi:MAG: tyrosine-type recombinase/integrase, partial [Candidatus Methanofastidiosia archaeon]
MKSDLITFSDRFYSHLRAKGLSKTYCEWLRKDYLFIARRAGTPFPSAEDLLAVYSHLLDNDRSASRLRNYCKTVKHYCGYADIDPPDIKPPTDTSRRVTYLTEIEATRLLYACDSIRDYAMLCLMLYGGLRRSEITNLKMEDLELEKRIIHVESTKTHVMGEVVISKKAADALREWILRRHSEEPWVFLSRYGKKFLPERISKIVNNYGKKARLKKNVTPHVLRHTMA